MFRDNIKIIRDYFKLVKGHKLWLFLLLFSSIMVHIFSLLAIFYAANIIYQVTNHNVGGTYLNIFFLFSTYIFYNLFGYLNYKANSNNFRYSYKKLREKIMDKIYTFDSEYPTKISNGAILNTINTDITNLAEMTSNICELIVIFFKIVVLIFIFLKTNIFIGIFVILLELLYLKTYDYCNLKSIKYLRNQQKYRDKLTDSLAEILNGLNEIKVFNIYNKIKENFHVIASKWSKEYMAKSHYVNIRANVLNFIIHFGKIILYLVLASLVLKDYYEVNILILLITYFENIMTSTKELMIYASQVREWSVSIMRINKILNYNSLLQIDFGNNPKDYIYGLVEFKNVTFTYRSKNTVSLNKLNFTAEPNEITVIVGKTGSGKTTIANLLLRRNKIDNGVILLDKENIYNYTEEAYAKNVIGVNQNSFIFNMSIRKNLNLINPNKEEQIEACKRVGLHDYIMSLPEGYNTVLTDNAGNFSNGEKSLLAIARTLLSKAEVLIFDEITNALDPLLNEKIKDILENLKLDHTIIIITHKKDIMKLADKIVVLDNGEVVGIDTHTNLLKNNKFYKSIQKSKE